MIDQKSPAKPDKNQKQETKSTNSSSKPAFTMADLMKSVKTSFKTIHKGDTINGKIKKLTSGEILVDINAKTDAVVLEKDKKILKNILFSLKVGEDVEVTILNPESEMGYPVVSLRRFMDNILWDKLSKAQKAHSSIEGIITEAIKGGFIVTVESGISGFLPSSYIHFPPDENVDLSNLQVLINRRVKVYVLELNRKAHKIIFSQKPILDAAAFDELIKNLKVEQKIDAIISNITPFGVFVNIPISGEKYVDGLIHISEISWEKVSNIEELFKTGGRLETVVIGIDRDAKRVDLSIKRGIADPFEKLTEKYNVDQKVSGTVTNVSETGITIKFGEENLEGFIRREKIPPTVSYKAGDSINATISQIDKKKRKILLTPVLLEKFVGYK